MRPTPPLLLAATVLMALPLAGAPAAQDLPAPGEGFDWERVGDRHIQPYGLAFGPDATLWAIGGDGPYRLDTSAGFPGTWVLLRDSGIISGPILALGRGADGDTLLVCTSGSVRRSTDGGRTWEKVRDIGGGGLFEVPPGLPWAGRVLAAATSSPQPDAVGYSDDRGATFADALMPGEPGFYADALAFAAYPPGSPWAGRILAAGRWGASVSDEGGERFQESGLWDRAYRGEGVAVVAHPGGGHGAIVGGRISATSGHRAWASGDGGATWGPEGGVLLPEGPPIGPGSGSFVFALGGMSALAVLPRGTVYRTDDAGATWAAVGRAPEVNEDIYLNAAALSPDGRLYVGLIEIGFQGEGWVWRTEVLPPGVPVPAESGPEEEGGESLGLAVVPNPFREGATVALALSRPSSVSASLYDGLGRRVAVLHEGPLPSGRHTLTLAGAGLRPGVYVVRVAAGTETIARTVTVLR